MLLLWQRRKEKSRWVWWRWLKTWQIRCDSKNLDFGGDTSTQYEEIHRSMTILLESSQEKWTDLAHTGSLKKKSKKLKETSSKIVYICLLQNINLWKHKSLRNFYVLSKYKFWSTHLDQQENCASLKEPESPGTLRKIKTEISKNLLIFLYGKQKSQKENYILSKKFKIFLCTLYGNLFF